MTRRSHPIRPYVLWALVVLSVVLAAASFHRRLGSAEPTIGVQWVQTRSGPVALVVEPGSPAWSTGLRPGDLLEAADGRPVSSALDAGQLPWQVRDGSSVSLRVRRGNRDLQLSVFPVARSSVPETYVYLAVVALAFLVSSVFLVMRWPTVRGGTVYGLLGLSLFLLLVLSHTGRGDLLDRTVYWIDVASGAAAPALLLHLALVLSRRAVPARRLALGLAYAVGAALVAFALWLVALGGVYRFPDPVLAVEVVDRMELLFLGVSVVLAVWLMARAHRRSASGLHRSQARWMLWGLGVGLAPFVTLYAVPWALGAAVPDWAQFFSVVPLLLAPAAFTVALTRYRLHDLDLVVRRGFAEVSAVLLVLAVYATTRAALRAGAGALLSASAMRYGAILFSAVAYPQVRSWVHAGVERAFYRRRYSYRATLLDWGRELNAETDLRSILDRLQSRVRETLGVPAALVLVRSGQRQFESVGTEDIRIVLELEPELSERLERERCVSPGEAGMPGLPWARHLFGMKVKGSLRAVMAIAEREALEEPLSSEDRALLSTFAAHAASAIEAARLLHEVRSQAEHVERLQARQEQILESSGVGLLLMEADGTILAWNRALEAIYGLPRDQALGQRVDEVFPLHMVRRMERDLRGAVSGREVRIYRHTLVNRNGQRIVVNLTVSPATHAEGDTGARVVSFDDVSERVKLEEQVLRQERLASLGLLAAGVAHEVNTPLTGISSYTQMLLEELPADDPRREVLEKIEVQSRRASNIANSLLNLARDDRGVLEEISLNEVVGEVMRLFEAQVRGRSIRLDASLDPHLPRIRGHAGKIQQILLNLLLNARDAVEAGGRITVSTMLRGEDVLLEVLDDGVGIAEEDLPRIFDPFFTTKGRGRGTGLGLSITHGIVQEHGGEVFVDSSPGEFTRFRVQLPARQPAEALA